MQEARRQMQKNGRLAEEKASMNQKSVHRARVGFFGVHGSNTEIAALRFFKNTAVMVPFKTSRSIFDAVRENKVAYGIVPVENSIEGIVTQNYDLLREADLKIVGEYILRIEHFLIANRGVRPSDVKNVYSHPQALAQCREYIEGMGANALAFSDTAGSVKMIKEKGLSDSAAIASKEAARLYRMHIISGDISTSKQNFTRFFILSAKAQREIEGAHYKTSLVFGVKDRPGALYNALRPLADEGINLTFIQSRPVKGRPWEYIFYITLEGHYKDKNLSSAVKGLSAEARFVRVMGSYIAYAAGKAVPI